MTEKNNPEVKKRAGKIRAILKKTYPDAHCLLNHKNALEILVATILAAQCTDARVNMTTPALFKKFRTAADYTGAPRAGLEKMIKSCGFFRNKAKAIRNCCAAIAGEYRGVVPDTMEELTALPGIGRKSANLILSCAYDKPGIIVDTHVRRLSNRLYFSTESNPDKIEKDLMSLFPRSDWEKINSTLVWHGRRVCSARKPVCGRCPVREMCPSAVSY